MGNYNSGGHNRTHGRVEEYSRIDSFSLLRYADWFERLSDYGEYHYPVMGGKIYYNLMENTARISHNGREYPLGLSKVPNVDGISYRLYFHALSAESVSGTSIRRIVYTSAGSAQG